MKKIILALALFTQLATAVKAQMGARIDQYYLDRSILIPAAVARGYITLATISYQLVL